VIIRIRQRQRIGPVVPLGIWHSRRSTRVSQSDWSRLQHSFDIVASGYVLHNLTANYRERLYDEIHVHRQNSGFAGLQESSQ
jgi:hypothetical protein